MVKHTTTGTRNHNGVCIDGGLPFDSRSIENPVRTPIYSHPQIDGKVNQHQISRDLLFHLFGDDYILDFPDYILDFPSYKYSIYSECSPENLHFVEFRLLMQLQLNRCLNPLSQAGSLFFGCVCVQKETLTALTADIVGFSSFHPFQSCFHWGLGLRKRLGNAWSTYRYYKPSHGADACHVPRVTHRGKELKQRGGTDRGSRKGPVRLCLQVFFSRVISLINFRYCISCNIMLYIYIYNKYLYIYIHIYICIYTYIHTYIYIHRDIAQKP